MRILIISNFYPPVELGGWEQLTAEMVEDLQGRGHKVLVLTSDYRAETVQTKNSFVWRCLKLQSDVFRYRAIDFLRWNYVEKHNFEMIDKALRVFVPDIVFVHGMWLLPHSLAWYLEQKLPKQVVYYVAGDWPYSSDPHEVYWSSPPQHVWLRSFKRRFGKYLLETWRNFRNQRRLQFYRVACVSKMIREDLRLHAQIPYENSCVIYNAIDLKQFSPPCDWKPGVWKSEIPTFIFAGSLISNKGAHVALKGFAKALQLGLGPARLLIIGSGDPDYEHMLKSMTMQMQLDEKVHFLGRIQRSEMAAFLQQGDIFLFCTSLFEAMSRMAQEAMGCGLLVIGTTVGGMGELLVNGETGLVFAADDYEELARQILQAYQDPLLRERLAKNARERIVSDFNLKRMNDEIENFLLSVLQRNDTIQP